LKKVLVTIDEMDAADPPVFARVTDWAADVVPAGTLPKFTVEGDKVSVDGTVPVPLNGIRLGDPAALEATDKVAAKVPDPVG